MSILQIVQVILASLLIVTILIQNKGSGLSGMFGGSSEIYNQKRGPEKLFFILTIILAIAFIATAIISIVTTK